jgi:hypothetical protein
MPAQLVVGDGGTQLVSGTIPPSAAPFHTKRPTYANAITQFGYALVRGYGAGWRLKLYSIPGQRLTTCDFGAAPMRCT